jgi:hypothetical protein
MSYGEKNAVLTRFDVAPDHWCHVTLIVHEAGIEVWSFIWIRRHDVGLPTREWIFKEVKHSEKLSGWPAMVRVLPTISKGEGE